MSRHGELVRRSLHHSPFVLVLQLTGLIASSIVWDEVLIDAFTGVDNGVECVLETDTQIYTYSIQKGAARLKGEGDLHDRKFHKYGKSTRLTEDLFSSSSASYKLTLYPTSQEFDSYSTANPTIATVGAVLIILMTSMLFFLYDMAVHKEFDAKSELLEAKRQFVRFISHEVRTPLSSVCMGLTLLKEELENQGDSDDGDEAAFSKFSGLTDEIQENAEGAVDVLNDLLNYDKVQRGALQMELSILSIWDLIERKAAEFNLPAKKKNIKFNIEFAADEAKTSTSIELPQWAKNLKVVGDSVRVAQVVRNLLSNALKFTPEGGKQCLLCAHFVHTSGVVTQRASCTCRFFGCRRYVFGVR